MERDPKYAAEQRAKEAREKHLNPTPQVIEKKQEAPKLQNVKNYDDDGKEVLGLNDGQIKISHGPEEI